MNKMSMSNDHIAELGAALSAAQGEFPVVKFNAVNPHLRNKYADLGGLIEAVKPILSKHGLSVTQLVFTPEYNPGISGLLDNPEPDQLPVYEIGVTTVLIHLSGGWVSSSATMRYTAEKGLRLPQVAGSVITYLRRYQFGAILGLYSDEDTDGNDGSENGNAATGKGKEKASQKAYSGKTVLLHKHEYPAEWGKPLIDGFVISQLIDGGVPHLDGILQKLNLPFDTPVNDVITQVEKYVNEKDAVNE